MVEFVDTHCHIQSVDGDLGERSTHELWAKAPDLTSEAVLTAAREAGVTKLICVGCDLRDSQLAVAFVEAKKECWASIGLHPHEAQHYYGQDALLQEFAGLVSRPKVIAIGECGLDYYYEHSPKKEQAAVLHFQLQLAQTAKLPVIFHVREAFDDFWPIFDQYSGVRGVLHSFTDTLPNLERAVERGLCIGVNGIATFAKKEEQQAMYRAIPLQNLLLETDAPFLTPAPYRGKINEPKFVRRVAEHIAELRGDRLEDIASTTSLNAAQLFGI